MSRKSAEALSVITVLPGQRPDPPKRLTVPAADVWRSVVSTKPHDWFTADTCHLLEAYCHAVVSHRLISVSVAKFDEAAMLADSKGYDLLTRLQDRQARVMTVLATKMRLTPQSRYTPQAAATASKKVSGARPWDA